MSRSHIALKEVVSGDVVSIAPQETLRDALTVMVENSISALPVVDSHQRCIGVISVSDLLGVTKDLSDELNALSDLGGLDHEDLVNKLEHADLLTDTVAGWMSVDPITVRIDDSLRHAGDLMVRNRVHRLVVVDGEDRVVGVVTTMDLLSAYVDGGRG